MIWQFGGNNSSEAVVEREGSIEERRPCLYWDLSSGLCYLGENEQEIIIICCCGVGESLELLWRSIVRD